MNFTKYLFSHSLVLFLAGLGTWHVLPAFGNTISKREASLPRCPIHDAVEAGHIQEDELYEASGLVASHRNPGIYYSIQDSQTEDMVYAMRENGEAIGRTI